MNVIEKKRTRNFFAPYGVSGRSIVSYPIEYQVKEVPPRRSPHRRRHDGDNVIADLDASGNLVRSYCTPMLDSNVSMTVNDGVDNPVYYYNQDERQSVVNLTDDTGIVAHSYGYSAYGDRIDSLTRHSTPDTLPNRYTYTGRELSDTTGDFYFRYRWYGAGVASFYGRDPYDGGDLDPWEDPYFDPETGRSWQYADGLSLYNGYFSQMLAVDAYGLKCPTCNNKKCTNFASGDWYKTLNTIYCDGKGNLVVSLGNLAKVDTEYGISECVRKHEEQHKKDWKRRYGKDICKGCPKGHLPRCEIAGKEKYAEFLRKSECDAYAISYCCNIEVYRGCKKKKDQACMDRVMQWLKKELGSMKGKYKCKKPSCKNGKPDGWKEWKTKPKVKKQ